MNALFGELQRVRNEDPELEHILSVFEEIERAYNQTLEAMGVRRRHSFSVSNSAEVTLSFHLTDSSGD